MTSETEPMDTSASDAIERILADWKDQPGPLLPVLHGVQDALGHVPADAVPQLAKALNLSRAEVHGVISFYHHFRQSAAGRHVLRVCRAESCQAMGGDEIEAAAQAILGVDFHETSADGVFTLEPVYCLGQCACSPAVMIGDEVHARVTPQRLRELLDEYRSTSK